MNKILIVDDDESVRFSFNKLFSEPDFKISAARNGVEALKKIAEELPDLVILDIEMPGMSGIETLQEIKKVAPRIPVLMITAYGSSERVITALKYGAFEYIEKPFDIPRLTTLVEEALNMSTLAKREMGVKPDDTRTWKDNYLIGSSPEIKEVYKLIGKVATSDVNILIMGESGTGKELVARAIHKYSDRSEKLFLAVNCAAIPDNLLESELFGYEKGAFTGATRRKPGKFEQANEGTLFLDEISDMSLTIQAKLLRVLQEGTFERLGSNETLKSDVRIIAATNRNLEQAISQKVFREDLYYRLKVITITLPPLRTRKTDIPELIDFFLNKYRLQLKKSAITITPEIVQKMSEYNWPGNIRELENVLKRAILLSRNNVISEDIVQKELLNANRQISSDKSYQISIPLPAHLEDFEGKLYEHIIALVEKDLIIASLHAMEGNQVKTAKLLGISRVMLHDRLEKYGISTKANKKKIEE